MAPGRAWSAILPKSGLEPPGLPDLQELPMILALPDAPPSRNRWSRLRNGYTLRFRTCPDRVGVVDHRTHTAPTSQHCARFVASPILSDSHPWRLIEGSPRNARRSRGLDPSQALPGLAAMGRPRPSSSFSLWAVAVVRRDRIAPVAGTHLLARARSDGCTLSVIRTGVVASSARVRIVSWRMRSSQRYGSTSPSVDHRLVLASPCDPKTGASATLTAAGLRQGTFAA